MIEFIKNLKIKNKFLLLTAVIVTGFAAFGYFAYDTSSLVKVSGPLYEEVVQQKDLIADILPPPEYLVESYLVVHQLVEESDPTRTSSLQTKSKALRADYEQRHEYWTKNLPEGKIKQTLVETSYASGMKFLELQDNEFMAAIRRDDKREAKALLLGPLREAYEQHRAAIDEVVRLAVEESKRIEEKTANIIDQRTIVMISFAIGIICVVSLLAFFFARIIRTPIQDMVLQIEKADLSSQFNSSRPDEIGELQRSFDKFVGSIREVVVKASEASLAVASAVAEISSSVEEMAAGTTEQSQQANEVSGAVEEMAKTVADNSRNALDAVETAKKARTAAEQGGKVVDETVAGMKRIAEVVRRSAETVHELGKSSESIGAITGVIDDIADQTNLLALNAAIEAARAGEQGRGFAVVADEVRRLAERTTKATKEITAMIKKIQNDTKGAVSSMEQGTHQVNDGIALADKAGASLREIVAISQSVTEMISSIAAASEEQSSASEQIRNNAHAIAGVSNESSTAIQQVALAANDLNKLTENLRELLSHFKIGAAAGYGKPAPKAPVPKANWKKSNIPKSHVTIQADGRFVEENAQ